MADDLLATLTRFHREVVLPDVNRVVSEAIGGLEGRMNAHFDAIYQRFDTLESEYRVDGLQDQIRVLEERLGG